MNFYSLIVVAALTVFAVGNPIPEEAKVDSLRLYVPARKLMIVLDSSERHCRSHLHRDCLLERRRPHQF